MRERAPPKVANAQGKDRSVASRKLCRTALSALFSWRLNSGSYRAGRITFFRLIMETVQTKFDGRGDWIRTSDLPVPNRTLYQAEPRPDMLRLDGFGL